MGRLLIYGHRYSDIRVDSASPGLMRRKNEVHVAACGARGAAEHAKAVLRLPAPENQGAGGLFSVCDER